MALGLGHKYWVHVIKHFTGTLNECYKFMHENQPYNNWSWFELRGVVKVVKGVAHFTGEYQCDLVEDSHNA